MFFSWDLWSGVLDTREKKFGETGAGGIFLGGKAQGLFR